MLVWLRLHAKRVECNARNTDSNTDNYQGFSMCTTFTFFFLSFFLCVHVHTLQIDRSWLVHDTVIQKGDMQLGTAVDPVLIALPLLIKARDASVSFLLLSFLLRRWMLLFRLACG